ncbi:hypothetical protein DENSPDRAFT_839071 [Dentipellis sp. KUC8613]|nr:hypothetical protein DENSPDRAFT_839071 [Dentipellis sp. KUC8613]
MALGVASFEHSSPQAESKPVVHIPRSTDPPVYRLPSEILGAIFLFAIPRKADFGDDDEPPEEEEDAHKLLRKPWQRQTEAPSWTNVLYVCRHWQAVALRYPALWTRIYVSNPWWATTCLSLSRQRPLELALTQTEANLGNSCTVARVSMSHFHRMRRAHIVGSKHDFIATVLNCLERTPAPLLEEFSVECTCCENTDQIHESWFPQSLFAQRSSLRKLKIASYGCLQIPLLSHIFPSLTHLEISDPSFWTFETMDITIQCMEAWRQLEVLILTCPESHQMAASRISDRNAYPMAPPSFKIALPHLKKLRIGDCAMLADRFLRHLALAPSTALTLHCALFTAATLLHPLIVARSLLAHVPAGLRSKMARLDVRLRGGCIDLAGYTKHEMPSFDDLYYDSDDEDRSAPYDREATTWGRPRAHAPTHYQLALVLGQHDGVLARPGYLGGVFEQLHFCRTFDMTLHIEHALPAETWMQMLRPLRRLEDLHFRCDVRAPLLDELVEVLGTPVPGAASSAYWDYLFLPQLKLLDVHFSVIDEEMWRYLAEVLVWRNELGAELDFLLVYEPKDDAGKYRPDKQTLQVLEGIVNEEIMWKVEDSPGISVVVKDEDVRMSEGEV